ncbi:unnamed protein product [Schistosoma curassoni]|uniref:Reverse transcriptase domain-containing protein n=1 Tax=Schistosoma curassoni TaxID=6186 RepID=A0A183JSS1_9TREM|nr:unnamed protein product [Schistosoma curassoni]
MVHGGQLTDAMQVEDSVKQRCSPSPFIFLLVVDWIMKISTSDRRHGIQWTARSQLDDLDFADGLALISHAQQQMQIKITSVSAASASVGLDIHKGKASSLNITQRTPNQSHLMRKLWKMRNHSRIWTASSMNKKDLMQT